jgi:hypothetical protein
VVIEMKKLFFILALAFAAGADTHTVASAEYVACSTAVALYPNDTIYIPADTATWDKGIVALRGISIIGAGVGKTRIISNYTNPSDNNHDKINYLVCYQPSATAVSNDEPFRFSGITLDLNNRCMGILIDNYRATPITKIRIDNDTIKGATTNTGTGRGIEIHGTVYGCIYSCVFVGNKKCIDSYGANKSSWDSLTFSFGSASNIYYEDNTFYNDFPFHSSESGGRYCSRKNTYFYTHASDLLSPWFDIHGNQTAIYGSFGAEIYDNTITATNNTNIKMYDLRGGKGLIYNNNIVTTGTLTAQVREEYQDSISKTTNIQPQHVSESYLWNNTKNLTTATDPTITSTLLYSDSIVPELNREYWVGNASFDGSLGIGYGLYANRPSTCSVGVTYWATDSLVLYRCESTNVWTRFYKEYTYPHPLRGVSPNVCNVFIRRP